MLLAHRRAAVYAILSLIFIHLVEVTRASERPKVLFYVPNLSYSHVAFNGKVADLLASRGYDVVSD